jgi:hypothetical protein
VRRVALVSVLVVLAVAGPVRAQEPMFILPGPQARSYTIAGGGTAAPRPGRTATEVRLAPREAVALADGRVVIREDEVAGGGSLVVVDVDGRIGALPPFPPIEPDRGTVMGETPVCTAKRSRRPARTRDPARAAGGGSGGISDRP